MMIEPASLKFVPGWRAYEEDGLFIRSPNYLHSLFDRLQ